MILSDNPSTTDTSLHNNLVKVQLDNSGRAKSTEPAASQAHTSKNTIELLNAVITQNKTIINRSPLNKHEAQQNLGPGKYNPEKAASKSPPSVFFTNTKTQRHGWITQNQDPKLNTQEDQINQ